MHFVGWHAPMGPWKNRRSGKTEESSMKRRHLLGSPFAMAVVSLLRPASSVAAIPALAANVPATPTNLTSGTERAISYRNQQHMWQTDDGGTHLLINRWPLSLDQALTLASSFDNGVTWTLGPTLSNTNYLTTADGVLQGASLSVAYSVADGSIQFAVFTYDAALRTWRRGIATTVFAGGAMVGLTPAIATDALGTLWCCYTVQDVATFETSIRMAYRPAGAARWSDTGLTFGEVTIEVEGEGTRRAGRPVPLPDGVGMIFTLREKIHWAARTNGWPASTPWTTTTIFASEPPFEGLRGGYGGHYSMVMDRLGNIHLITVDQNQGIYFRYAHDTAAWEPPRPVRKALLAIYTQATMCGDTLMLITSTGDDSAVYQSTDFGLSFVNTHRLMHAPAPPDGSIDYADPRQESPTYSRSPVPVLQQYSEGATQKLMYFAVPALNAVE